MKIQRFVCPKGSLLGRRTHKQVIKINWKLLGLTAHLCFLPSPFPSFTSSLPLSLMSLMPTFLHFIFLLRRWIGFLCSVGPWQIQVWYFWTNICLQLTTYIHGPHPPGRRNRINIAWIKTCPSSNQKWPAGSRSLACCLLSGLQEHNQRCERWVRGNQVGRQANKLTLITCLEQDLTAIQMFSLAQKVSVINRQKKLIVVKSVLIVLWDWSATDKIVFIKQ